MFYILFLLPAVLAAPIALQSRVTLPPMIAANLDEYAVVHFKLGALMGDLDMLYYAEEGTLTPEELKEIVKDTYETADQAMKNRIRAEEKLLKERAEELTEKGVTPKKVEEPKEDEDLDALQNRILKARESLLDVGDDEESPEVIKKKYEVDEEILATIRRLHIKLKQMIKDGEFEKDTKASMKILGPRGPFGTALV